MDFKIYNEKNNIQFIKLAISNHYDKESQIDINFSFKIPKLIKNYDLYSISLENNIEIPKNKFYIYTKQNYHSICILNFLKEYKLDDAISINFDSNFLNLHLYLPSKLKLLISKFEKLILFLNEFKNIIYNFDELSKKDMELTLILDNNFLDLCFDFNFNISTNKLQVLNKTFEKTINLINKISNDFKFNKFELTLFKDLNEETSSRIRIRISALPHLKNQIQDLSTKLASILKYSIPYHISINYQNSNPYVEIALSDNSRPITIDSAEFFKDIGKSIEVTKFLNSNFIRQIKNNISSNQLSKKEINFFSILSKKFEKEFNEIEDFLKLLEL